MTWQPRWHHVTQLHPNGSGENDCWPASLARYLRERNPGVSAGTDDFALINAIDLLTHGTPDSPNNPDTTLPEASTSLAHYGIAVDWSDSYQAALAAPWSILLVDGTALRPSNYPSTWFGDPGQANHFIVWLPNWKGVANWFNDPLVPQGIDVQYDLNSMAAAFYGAYLLPSTGNGETAPAHWKATVKQGLKPLPNHTSTSIETIPAGAKGIYLDGVAAPSSGGEHWRHVQFRDKYGFVLAANLEAA